MADGEENPLIIQRLVPVLSLRPFVTSSRDLKKDYPSSDFSEKLPANHLMEVFPF